MDLCCSLKTKCLNPRVIIFDQHWSDSLTKFCSFVVLQGQKCGFTLCKQCCRSKCYVEELDCPGHRILVKTRRAMARESANSKTEISNPDDCGNAAES